MEAGFFVESVGGWAIIFRPSEETTGAMFFGDGFNLTKKLSGDMFAAKFWFDAEMIYYGVSFHGGGDARNDGDFTVGDYLVMVAAYCYEMELVGIFFGLIEDFLGVIVGSFFLKTFIH